MRVYKDIEVEIEFEDVIEYITDYATNAELDNIREEIKLADSAEFDNQIDGTYIQEEKMILLTRAAKKYTLAELEERLGNKFDLI